MSMPKIYLLVGAIAVLGLGGVFLIGGGNDTLTALATLKKPDLLTATAISTNQILLNWIDTNSSEEGYEIYRSLKSGGGFSQIAIAPQNSTSYQDQQGLSISITYYYRLRAVRGGSHSTYSTEASVTTLAINPSPTPTPTPALADTTPPTLSVTNPANGASFYSGQTINIGASSTDNVRVSRVLFSGGSTLVPETTDTTAPYGLSVPVTSSSALGQHCFFVYSYDTSENRTSAGPRCFYVVAVPTPTSSPDLYINSGALRMDNHTSTTVRVGDSIRFGAVIFNLGSSTAISSRASLRLDINYVSGTPSMNIQTGKTIPEIPAKSNTWVEWPDYWVATAGTHRMEVCADITHLIIESNETNNCGSWVFVISPNPSPLPSATPFTDLYMVTSSVRYYNQSGTTTVKSWDWVTFAGKIQNIGNLSATSSQTRLRIDVNYSSSTGTSTWDLTSYQPIGALGAFASTTVLWPSYWRATPGTHQMEICSNATFNIYESNYANNCFAKIFNVAVANANYLIISAGHHWSPILLNTPHTHSGAWAKDENDDLASYNWSIASCYTYTVNPTYSSTSIPCPTLSNPSGYLTGGFTTTTVPGPTFTPSYASSSYKLILQVFDSFLRSVFSEVWESTN